MPGTSASLLRKPADQSRLFDGFPYLVTRIVPSLHHIILLPRIWTADQLIATAQQQIKANRLPTCLVVAANLCVYFREDGSAQRSSGIPGGVSIVSEKLAPTEPIAEFAELLIRRMELILFEEAQHQGSASYQGDSNPTLTTGTHFCLF